MEFSFLYVQNRGNIAAIFVPVSTPEMKTLLAQKSSLGQGIQIEI
jgi:hypothetical protein